MPRFGFIHDKLEIKFLILYILSRAALPLDMSTLAEITLRDEGIDYFQFAEALSELVSTEHVTCTEDRTYLITEKGKRNGAICESSLPYSVRMHAEEDLVPINARMRREAMVKASRAPRASGGFTVSLSLDDDFENIMTLRLFSPSDNLAQRMEEHFRHHPERIYHAVMTAVLEPCSESEEDVGPAEKEKT